MKAGEAMAPPDSAGAGDCWNRIGVWSRGTDRCPKLDQVVHCRNCAVYAAAGRRLLDRAHPPGYASDWAATLACPPPSPRGAAAESVLVFRIGDEWLALPTALICEVSAMRAPRTIPHRSKRVVWGLVNVRGELLVYVSLGRLFGIQKGRRHQLDRITGSFAARIIVIEEAGQRFAFPASEVEGIRRFAPAELRDVPTTIAHASASFLRGIFPAEGRHVGYLDGRQLTAALTRHLT